MKNTAIIFFSLDFHEEEKNKALFGKDRTKNRALAKFLIEQSEQGLQKSGLDTFRFSAKNQIGSTFGEKLANAFETVFELGYKQVIAVGNDTLDLRNSNWNQIVNELNQGNCVLGPTQRGGSYLIGFEKTHFEKESFRSLPWQSKHLFEKLLAFCEDRCEQTYLLAQGQEINDLNDLKQVLESENLSPLHRPFLKNLFYTDQKQSVTNKFTFHVRCCIRFESLRAPPLFDHVI